MSSSLPNAAAYTEVGAPSLEYSEVWSANIAYDIIPASALWDGPGDRILFSRNNHNLANNDEIDMVVGDASLNPGWSQTGVVVTVIDTGSFSVPQTFDPGDYPMDVINGKLPVNSFKLTCQAYSRLMFNPKAIQIEALPASTEITVQAKVHPSASWVDIQVVDDTDGLTQVVFTTVYALVRCALTSGTGQPVVYAQLR